MKNYTGSPFRKNKLASFIAMSLGSVFVINNSAAAQQPDSEQGNYEKIVVTGQKITRTLQETPASIAVFSTDKLEQQNVGDFSEVLFETANVHSEPSGNFSIRGIDAISVTGGGNSGLASVYVDGASMPNRAFQNGISTWDVSQVEVLRGPQSTIQGRNSLAGAVILTTKAPTQEWGGKYRAQVGEHGEKEFAVAVGGGLIDNELAFRFSAEQEEFDGFNHNITRNEDSDHREDELYRLKLLYTPKDLPELSAQLSASHSDSQRGPLFVQAVQNGNQFASRSFTANEKQDVNDEIDIVNLEVKYDINETWQLLSLSTYSKGDTYWNEFDSDSSFLDTGTRFLTEEAQTLSQELRLTFNYDKLSGVVGAYYFTQEIDQEFGGIQNVDISQVGVNTASLQNGFGLSADIAALTVSQYNNFNPGKLNQITATEIEVNTFAIFADFTYEINEQWDIFAGIRWDKEEQSSDDLQLVSLDNIADLPDPANYTGALSALSPLITGINNIILSGVANANGDTPLVDDDFNEIIPKVGVSYHWNDDITTSFSAQQGYRSGGVGVNQATAEPFQYDAEFTTNYELSMRSFWLDGDLMINANVFYIDWKDQQIEVQLSTNEFNSEIKNAGESVLTGFEFEAYYQVNDNLELTASIGQANSEFKDFLIVIPTENDDIEQDLSGRSFADAPEWTGNLTANYTSDNGFVANVSANYANSSLAVVNPYVEDIDAKNDARTLINMQIGYEWDSVGIYLIGKNILDEEYFTDPLKDNESFNESSVVQLGNERQISLSLRGSF